MGGLKIKDLVNEGWAVSLVFESSITLSSCFEDERTDVTATLLYRVAETGASLTVGHGDEVGAMQTVAAFERDRFAPDGPLLAAVLPGAGGKSSLRRGHVAVVRRRFAAE